MTIQYSDVIRHENTAADLPASSRAGQTTYETDANRRQRHETLDGEANYWTPDEKFNASIPGYTHESLPSVTNVAQALDTLIGYGSGYSGFSGYSGATGAGTSGFSGYSGASGTPGSSQGQIVWFSSEHSDMELPRTGFVTTIGFSGAANPNEIYRTSGSFLADGFKPGHRITVNGASHSENNTFYELVDVTATKLVLVHHESVTTEAPGASIEIKSEPLHKMVRVPSTNPEHESSQRVESDDGDSIVFDFLTEPGYPGVTTIPAGLWVFHGWFYVSSTSGTTTRALFRVSKVSTAGTLTELFKTSREIITATNVSNAQEVIIEYSQSSDITLLTSDRIHIDVMCTTNTSTERTMYFLYEGSARASYVITPMLQLGAVGASGYSGFSGFSGAPGTGLVSGSVGYLAAFDSAVSVGNSNIYIDGDYTTLLSTKSTHAFDSSNLMMGGAGPGLSNLGSEEYAVRNTTYGINSGELLSTGSNNTLVGCEAGYNTREKDDNVIIGCKAGLQVGNGNTIVGSNAMPTPGDGNGNVAIGYGSLWANSIGDNNTAIGTNSCANLTEVAPVASVYIGYDTYCGSDIEAVKEVVIGSGGVGLGSHSIVFGDTDNEKVVMYGNLGINNTDPKGLVHPVAAGLEIGKCTAMNVGNTDASVGTFTRDLASPMMCRSDCGTLTDGGLLKILGVGDSDTTSRLNYTGWGYVWAECYATLSIRSTYFSFDGEYMSIFNASGDVFEYDIKGSYYEGDGLAIFVDQAVTGVSSSTVSIRNYPNFSGGPGKIGYSIYYSTYRKLV